MNSLTFITDETTNRRYAQIDLTEISEINDEELEDLMDILVAEARRGGETITLEEVRRQLKAEGLL